MSAVVTTAVTPPEGVKILEQGGKFHAYLAENTVLVCTFDELVELDRRIAKALGASLVATNPELQP